ncbi:hypothetical protein MTO96_028493 [Rhipicephalus appendiculatus]
MAPRRKKPTKQARVKAAAPKGSEPVPTCAFCDLPQGDDINGELLSSGSGLHVHYFCLLFSSGLHQRGEENEPLRGFVEADVRAELRRGSRLICCFCKRKNATVGCCLRACKKAFHMPCGVAKDCLLQFFGDFRQLFHRACIQRQAVSAGSHFFRCCHCNNQEAFQREMQDHGIYVPDQDASWEREPHAFEELLFRYQHCDAPRCSCPLGRSHHQEDGRWKMVVCDSCGSQGVHASCGNVGGTHWICTECRQIINRVPSAAQQSSSGRFEKHPSQQQPEVIEIDSDDEDEAPRPQRHTERQTSSHAERVTANGCRLLDFAMRGSSNDDSATLQLMLETISGSVIVADISLSDHSLIVS